MWRWWVLFVYWTLDVIFGLFRLIERAQDDEVCAGETAGRVLIYLLLAGFIAYCLWTLPLTQ